MKSVTVRAAVAVDPETGRVETGPVQFGDDWPGVFIRGDCAAACMLAIEGAVNQLEPMSALDLNALFDILASCQIPIRSVPEITAEVEPK